MSEFIPVMKPKLPGIEKLSPIFIEMEKRRIYSNFGPVHELLKEEYSKYLQVSPNLIVPIVNATLGIQGCLEILGQRNWILPDYTFAATGHAAVSARKNIYISDVRIDNFQLDLPTNFQKKHIGALPVMPFGAPVIFEDWQGFDSLIIDAAASLGSPPPNFAEMPIDSMVVYSLHATKVFGAGEGAIVVCQNVEIANRLRTWSNFGFDASRASASSGTNAKMSEISCAVALASILDKDLEKREWESRHEYVKNLEYPDKFRTITESYSGFCPYWIIQLENLREKLLLVEYLRSNGIETRSWWPTTLSEMPAFANLEKITATANSKHFSESHLGLPMWKEISNEQLQYITKCLRDFNLIKT